MASPMAPITAGAAAAAKAGRNFFKSGFLGYRECAKKEFFMLSLVMLNGRLRVFSSGVTGTTLVPVDRSTAGMLDEVDEGFFLSFSSYAM